MEKHLNKRILGAVVTVLALGIAVPIVIDGSSQRLTIDQDMPPMPDMPDWTEVQNQQRIRIDLEQLASGEAAAQLLTPQPGTAATEPTGTATASTATASTEQTAKTAAATAQQGTAAGHGEPVTGANTVAASTATPAVTPAQTAKPVAAETGQADSDVLAGLDDMIPAAVRKQPDRGHLDDSGLPYAWVVQLGAFSSADNAMGFRDTIRQQGFKAFARTDDDGLTRVFAGPELQQQQAETLRSQLEKKLQRSDLRIKRFMAR
ncbi:SPOR domain-containing protein [Oceanobacter sp. 4_MG-2023]|uniref:SPOR domain-containing protein n=1 Tax=Oceanobacter sp. 4_MG-2023 TaxID=3062623 RepID=UPI00273550CE|nr:SPOR domain-containing protein [Oceanobacter sp. 4_MG-2023]MDP2548822.1 SPOR domain-containing protein [Oceanobacter sp. 4_MG-2023]